MENSSPQYGRITAQRNLKQGGKIIKKKRIETSKTDIPTEKSLYHSSSDTGKQGAIKTFYSQNVILLTSDLLSSLHFESDFNWLLDVLF